MAQEEKNSKSKSNILGASKNSNIYSRVNNKLRKSKKLSTGIEKSLDILSRKRGLNPRFTQTLILDTEMDESPAFGGYNNNNNTNKFKNKLPNLETFDEMGINIQNGEGELLEYEETEHDREIISDLQDFIEMLHSIFFYINLISLFIFYFC